VSRLQAGALVTAVRTCLEQEFPYIAAERSSTPEAEESAYGPVPRVKRRMDIATPQVEAPPGLAPPSVQQMSGFAGTVPAGETRATVFGRRGGAPHLDARLVDKPGKYSGERGDWRLWKARATGWLVAVHSDFGRFLAAAESHQGDMYVPQPLLEMSSFLHTELLAWLTGTQLAVVLRNLPLGGGESNGFAAWRTLCEEEERLDLAAQVAVLQEPLHPSSPFRRC